MLSDCELIEAECIFILIDNGVVSDDVCDKLMECMFHKNFEMYVFIDWLLMRWVLLRKHRFHLPNRRRTNTIINLTNLINCYST